MRAMASQITSLTIVYSSVYSGADQRKHQSSASLAFVRGIHPVTGEFPAQRASNTEMFPFDDVIMIQQSTESIRKNITEGLLSSIPSSVCLILLTNCDCHLGIPIWRYHTHTAIAFDWIKTAQKVSWQSETTRVKTEVIFLQTDTGHPLPISMFLHV